MARVIPPGYAEVSQELRRSGYPRSAYVTYGIKVRGTVGVNLTLAEQAYEAFTLPMRNYMDSDVVFGRCRVVIGQDAAEPLVDEFAGQLNGQASRESPPPAIAILVTKNTGVGGRRNRGRMFIPWYAPEGSISEVGTLTTGVISNIQSNVNDMLLALQGFDADPEIPSWDLLDGMVLLHGPGLGAPTPVTSLTVSPTVSTQRRRQVR